jgi:hypothetical protein
MTSVATASETLVERIVREGPISMAAASRFYGEARPGVPTHRATPSRHALRGIRLPDGSTLKLEAIRVNGALRTSRAAVIRFLERQQSPDAVPDDVAVGNTPSRVASAASRELDAALGVR